MTSTQTWYQRLTLARKAAQISKAALALKVGVSAATVTQWEQGLIKDITGVYLISLCDTLKITPKWLLHGEGATPESVTSLETVGMLLQRAREDKGWTVETLAENAAIGVDILLSWEADETAIPPEELSRLAELLGVKLKTLQGEPLPGKRNSTEASITVSGMELIAKLSLALANNRLSSQQVTLLDSMLLQFGVP